jgi:methionine-rich copper-binding protein CopC
LYARYEEKIMAKRFAVAIAAACIVLLSGTGGVSAHASLTRCSIKNNEVFRVGHTPKQVTAYFAEPLDPNKSWIAIFEGQADHGLVTEKHHSQVSFKNPQEMTLRISEKLGKEKYYLMWYTRSAKDGHFAAGIVYFRVK